jgi:hypothetical protein
LVVARHLPPGRLRAGDRHFKFYERRDILDQSAPGTEREVVIDIPVQARERVYLAA